MAGAKTRRALRTWGAGAENVNHQILTRSDMKCTD